MKAGPERVASAEEVSLRGPLRMVVGLFVLFSIYAVVRYHLAKDIAWDHFPAYVLNKSISWTGLVLIGMSRVSRVKATRSFYGLSGLAFVGLHVPLSLATLTPFYHERLFLAQGGLAWNAQLALLAGACGVIAVMGLYTAYVRKSSAGLPLVPHLGRVAVLLGVIHVAAIGFPTWLKPGDWYWGLPPITLLSVLMGLVFLFLPVRRA